MTTRTTTTKKWKSNFPNITPSPDPEPRNKRALGKANCNDIKTGCLCPVLKSTMVLEAHPGGRLAEENH